MTERRSQGRTLAVVRNAGVMSNAFALSFPSPAIFRRSPTPMKGHDMTRLTRGLIFVTTAAALVVLSSPLANAFPTAAPKGATTLVLFAENRGIARLDNNAQGPSNGDLVHRELALSRTLSGEVIGVSYSQAEIVAYNPEAKTDVRRVDVEDSLPGGWLFIRGMSTLPIGSLPQAGWTDTYAVIGGTGIYAGVHGYERLTLLADGKTFRVVFTLWH
jgi:hypothetical protein